MHSDEPALPKEPRGFDLAGLDAAAAWRCVADALQAAAESSRHPLHLVTVATVDHAGAPDARTVVLRRFDRVGREAWFHTDARSPKAAAMRHEPRVSLHWYDPALRLQIRIPAHATVHHADDASRAAWEASRAMSRACYTSHHAPGEAVSDFLPAPRAPAAGDDAGFAHFAAVRCRFDSVELLALHASGHQRARLEVVANPIRWIVLAP